jgi:diadenosine tetraphosphate (Ap4A) HIT family hydrolase
MTSADCCLCSQLRGDPAGDLLHAHFGGDYERRAKDVDAGFALVPSLGALVTGHLLLCPQLHTRSFAQLPADQLRRVPELVEWLAARLRAVAGDEAQLFEHGDAKDSDRISCSVDHAHLHVLPGIPDIWPAARAIATWSSLPSLADLPDAVGNSEYLALYARSGGWRVAIAPAAGHPSQLIRRLIAESLGAPDSWNWREHPELGKTSASWRLVREVASA